MLAKRARLWVGTLLAVLILAACSASMGEEAPGEVLPNIEATSEAPILNNGETPEPTALPAIPEQRMLVLEWPRAVRAGDGAVVRLSLEMDEEGRLTPTARVAGNEVRGEPFETPNLYATHNVVARARLDLAGVDVAPLGEVAEPMQPGQAVNFFWSIRPETVGRYAGAIWVHLEFVPRDPASGEQMQRITLSAQQFEFEATNILGVGGPAARLMGGVGIVLGALLGLDQIFAVVWRTLRALFSRRERA